MVSCVGAIGNMNFIRAIRKGGSELRWCGVGPPQIQTQAWCSFRALRGVHFDVAQSGRRQDASRQFEHIRDVFSPFPARKSPAASPFRHGNLPRLPAAPARCRPFSSLSASGVNHAKADRTRRSPQVPVARACCFRERKEPTRVAPRRPQARSAPWKAS